MFRNLMHAFTGSPLQNAAQGVLTSGIISHQGLFGTAVQDRRTLSKKIFSGNIEVQQVSNGYVVNIATREGYEYTTYIAHTIVEVNEIIASAMVAFQLEQ